MQHQTTTYKPTHAIRIVTAASLFDGHDAAINLMRRILQASGAEVIHLGHNRSGAEIVDCAIQEDAQAVAITSYQGGLAQRNRSSLSARGESVKYELTFNPENITAAGNSAGSSRSQTVPVWTVVRRLII